MNTLDKWAYLLGETPRIIILPQLLLESGRDWEPTIVEGRGEVRIITPYHFEYTLTGRPVDVPDAIKRLRNSQDNPYKTFEQFRLTGHDKDGVKWMLGWSSPVFHSHDGDDWVLTGGFSGLSTDDYSTAANSVSSVENIFEIPRETQIAQLLTQLIQTPQKPGQLPLRERTLNVLGTQIRFAYLPDTGRLTLTAPTSSGFDHPYAENWLAEPLRILFGQLIFPRLVARNFGDGRAAVSLRQAPGFVRDAGFAALWAKQFEVRTPEVFWDLYSRLLIYIAYARKDEQPNFHANPLTNFYEELVQAARGSRWVWALTLASVVEGMAKMLFRPGDRRKDIDEAAIEGLCKHIEEWKGDSGLKGQAINGVKQSRLVTPTLVLAKLRDVGLVPASHVASWKEIRNQVMHGSLVSPWSLEEEDQKILALSNLVHALTLQLIPANDDIA